MRFIFLLHRYLGIGVGLLMAMWCLSGIVMMYVPYPALAPAERLKGLAPLDWTRCCTTADLPGLDDATRLRALQIEMLDGRPALRLATEGGRRRLLDLTNGREISEITPNIAGAVAREFSERHGLGAWPSLLGTIERDQWTVGGFNPDKPLYHLAMNDPAGTELYVSSTTGRAVQITTATERFWNWLGAVPHWLYPTMLRQNPALWSEIVNWTSLTGCFLTITGIYIGLRQLKRRNSTHRLASPYRGVMFLHHIPGLVFGLFALTWIASGLFSMNPWGLWEGGGDGAERQALAGTPPDWAAAKEAIASLQKAAIQGAPVSIEAAPFEGKLFLIATAADGTRTRLDMQGRPAPFSAADLAQVAALLSAGDASARADMLREEDAYYFAHHREQAPLPVFRVVRNDTGWRYYVDPVSGVLKGKIDDDGKMFRWMHQGLHRLDFTAGLRARPVWDLVMLPLLLGVTFLCAIGAYLGLRSLLWKKSA